MKARNALYILIVLIMILSVNVMAFSSQGSQSLDSIIAENKVNDTETEVKVQEEIQEDRNQSFINGLVAASDLAVADIQGAEKVTEQIRYIAAWIVQVISYGTMAFLVVRVMLDMIYIALPFTRSFLTKQSGAGQSLENSMGANMGAMQPGAAEGLNNQAVNQGPRQHQIISNAAINAVDNSNGQSPLRVYAKDMIITLIAIPVLITLTTTGVLTSLGFAIGEVLIDLLELAIKMIGT